MKTVIIGIDGVSYGTIRDLTLRGIMPNVRNLFREGTLKKMESTIPEISSVSWSSIITGKNPGEHGIFGFSDLIENTYSLQFPNFKNLKAKAFWEEEGEKSVIINVPSTYPAKELGGFLVSGFVAPDMKKAVFPPNYLQKLEEINYEVDVDSEKGHSSKQAFMRELFETLEKRGKLLDYALSNFEWNNFMFVITGSDRLQHFLFDAYEDENHEYHKVFLDYFRKVDELIGRITQKVDLDKDVLVLLSDHGMERKHHNVNINAFLQKEGYLKLGENLKLRHNNLLEETSAFSLDPARIYLNKKEKYPRGSIGKVEEQETLKKLISSFENLRMNDKAVIKRIFTKEEIYHGPLISQAPDLVLLPEEGFGLRSDLEEKEIFTRDIFTGKHTQDDAFLYINTKEENLPEKINVFKVLSIIKGVKDGKRKTTQLQ